jgi:hypothetical protein
MRHWLWKNICLYQRWKNWYPRTRKFSKLAHHLPSVYIYEKASRKRTIHCIKDISEDLMTIFHIQIEV